MKESHLSNEHSEDNADEMMSPSIKTSGQVTTLITHIWDGVAP
jgi:hypothetical protein